MAYGIFTYDYSLRTFAIFIHPTIFSANKVNNELTRTIDVMPTILEVLNIEQDPSSLKMQGQSLIPLINNKIPISEENDFDRVAFSETGGLKGPWPSPNEPNVKCVRTKNWKLIHNLTPDTWELYNLKEDSAEEKNVYDNNLEIVSKLKLKLSEIEEDCNQLS